MCTIRKSVCIITKKRVYFYNKCHKFHNGIALPGVRYALVLVYGMVCIMMYAMVWYTAWYCNTVWYGA